MGVKDLADLGEVTVGEDKTSVQDESLSDDLEMRAGGLLCLSISFLHLLDSLLHEGVLSHNHDGVDLSELLAHNANLLGGDVVNVDEHALGVLVTAFLSVLPNFVLAFLLL